MGSGSQSMPVTEGGSSIGPYTQSIVNQMDTTPGQQPNQIALQKTYDQLFGTQPSYQSLANANALRMIDSLPLQQGKFTVKPTPAPTVTGGGGGGSDFIGSSLSRDSFGLF